MLLNNINWFSLLGKLGFKTSNLWSILPYYFNYQIIQKQKKKKNENYRIIQKNKWKEIWALDVFVGKLTKLQVHFDKPIA